MQQAADMAWLNFIKSQEKKEPSQIAYKFEGEQDITKVAINFIKIIDVWKLIANNQEINLVKEYPQLLQMSVGVEEKSVCAKTVNRGQTIVECYDCRIDSSCIICLNCFNNGDHKGHKVIFKKAYGGCCDCGDIQAWKETGFCKDHSGEVKDIAIEPQKVLKFCQIMEDIFYTYYRMANRQKEAINYVMALIDLCKSIVQKGITGIKLLSIFFASSMPQTHKFNSKLQQDSILSHLLTFQFMGGEAMREWENVFINMFPLYEFKRQLLATYIKYFVRIYKGDSNRNYGQSLSCQILTSYKLVEDYIQNENNLPLGHNINEVMTEKQDFGFILAADLDKINSLQGDTPYKYWKFYINHSIDSIFSHYVMLRSVFRKEKQNKLKNVKKDKKKKKKQNVAIDETQQEANSVISFIRQRGSFSQNEFNCIKTMNFTLQIISKDKALLRKLLQKLYQLIREDIEEDLIIFRPYQRVFCLTLFNYIERDISFLRNQNNRNQLRIDLGFTFQQWKILQNRLFNRMITTYFFFTHVLINDNQGQRSNYFHYLYFYHLKENLISNVDILMLKMIALLAEQPYQPIELPFDQLIRIKDSKDNSWSLAHFKALMEEINLLYIGKTSQIFIAHSVEKHVEENYTIFRQDISSYLKKFISSEGGSASFEKITDFSRDFLFNDQDILKKRLRQICEFNKEKKIFQLKENLKDPQAINFQDFYMRTKLVNKNHDAYNPKNTLNLITDYNRQIFAFIWSVPNLKSLRKIMLQLNQKLQTQKNKQELVTFYSIVCKFVYLLQNLIENTEKVEIIRQLVIIMDINAEIKKELKNYSDLLGEQEEIKEISSQGNQKIVDKKEEMRLKMLKKREELNKKNQTNLLKAQQIHVEELNRINSEKIVEEGTDNQNEEKYCVICRNKQEESYQLVYLTKLSFRDLQLMLQMGRGVKTLSFTTCYHSFHYDCIQRSAVAKSNFEIVFKCPICRKVGNTFFPVDPLVDIQKSKPFVESCLERIMQVIMTFKDYDTVDAVEQLIKSFYHYALLGMFQPVYLKSKKRNLYKIILKLLSADYLRGSVLLVKQKLKNSTITVRPKTIKENKKKLIMQRKADSSSEQDSEYQEQIELEEQTNNVKMIQMLKKMAKTAQIENQSPKQLNNQKSSQKKSKELTKDFIYVIQRVIYEIERTSLPKQQEIKIEEIENVPEVRKQLMDIMNDLFTEGVILNFIPLKIKLLELPEIYNWDMTKNVCEECKNICHDTMACLLCNWRGCLNCKEGGLMKHTREKHGQVCPIMRVNDSQSYLISHGENRRVGPLYANYYGDSFSIKNQWSEYFLQHTVQEQLERQLLKDE